jgi:hypothetical protein
VAQVALYDACVLYPASLRDLLVRLALLDLFQARWTNEIHDEWIRSILADRSDITPESLARCRGLMDLLCVSKIIGVKSALFDQARRANDGNSSRRL